jgi:hypothetical protein
MGYLIRYYAALAVLVLWLPLQAVSKDNLPTEEFAQFLAKFSGGGEFQLSRVADPLQTITVVVEEDFKKTRKAVPLETLRRSPSPVMPELGDYYQYSIVEISKTERKVLVQSRDSDVYVMDFIFRRNGCCWYLVRTEEMAY